MPKYKAEEVASMVLAMRAAHAAAYRYAAKLGDACLAAGDMVAQLRRQLAAAGVREDTLEGLILQARLP